MQSRVEKPLAPSLKTVHDPGAKSPGHRARVVSIPCRDLATCRTEFSTRDRALFDAGGSRLVNQA